MVVANLGDGVDGTLLLALAAALALGLVNDGAEAVVDLDSARDAHVNAGAAADALVSVNNGVRHESLLSQRAQGPQILSEHGSPYSRLQCLHTSQPSTAGRVA